MLVYLFFFLVLFRYQKICFDLTCICLYLSLVSVFGINSCHEPRLHIPYQSAYCSSSRAPLPQITHHRDGDHLFCPYWKFLRCIKTQTSSHYLRVNGSFLSEKVVSGPDSNADMTHCFTSRSPPVYPGLFTGITHSVGLCFDPLGDTERMHLQNRSLILTDRAPAGDCKLKDAFSLSGFDLDYGLVSGLSYGLAPPAYTYIHTHACSFA